MTSRHSTPTPVPAPAPASTPTPAPVRKDHLDALAVGLLLVCCLFWGLQQVLVKASMAEMPPVFQAAFRFTGATVLLWFWCRWRGVPLLQRDGTLWAGLLAGGLFAGEFAALYVGLMHTSASRLTMFLYTSPFWVAALLPWMTRTEHLRPVQWAGLACAFGAVVLAMSDGVKGAASPLGDGLALLAGMLWGLTTVTLRSSALTRASPEKLLFYQVAVSAVVLPLLSLALDEVWPTQLSAFGITSLAIQTGVGAFASYLVWMWMLGRYPATRISVFVFLTPVFALAFGALWLSEPITPAMLGALALVAGGIVLVNRR
jgi:drug/metabolite transporter (DMT)-like permease